MARNRIHKLRTASGLSRAEVAAKVGVESDRTVRRWENEESQVPDEKKLLLAEIFGGVEVPYLMGWHEDDDGSGDSNGGGEQVAA